MSRNTTAAKVAAHKAAHPEMYCIVSKCLYRTDALRCPRHAEAPYKAQAPKLLKETL